jgi:replicative DNA helicase
MSKLEQYGHSFQVKTLGCLVNDREFLQQVSDIVLPEYFDSEANKWVVKTTLKYFDEFKTTPTMEVFKVELDKIKNEIVQVAVKEQLKDIYRSTKANDLDFVKETFVDFCKNQTLKSALLRSVDLLELGDYDDIRNLIDNALKAGTEKSVGHEYVAQLEDRYKEDARHTIPTPWEQINTLLCGGIGKGDLGLIVGNPGGGKSWALVDIGALAIKLGYTVFHYTLELSDVYVGKRYDARFTEIPVGDLEVHKNRVKGTISDLRGNLIIKEFPAGQAGINTIEAHIEKCIGQGIEPDLIILDYADLLKGGHSKEKRERLDDIYTNLRGLATAKKLPIWTVSQVNRTASRENIIQGDRISESYGKIMIVDFAMSLSRKAEDKENGTGRLHVMKNRYGADGLSFDVQIDTSIGKFIIGDRISIEDEESPDGNGMTPSDRNRLRGAAQNLFSF